MGNPMDIVERLRRRARGAIDPLDIEAADEIDWLRTHLAQASQLDVARIREIERLRAENKQFGDCWSDIAYERDDLIIEKNSEVERLRSTSRIFSEALIEKNAENERLRMALKRIAGEGMDLGGRTCEDIAQTALDSETR